MYKAPAGFFGHTCSETGRALPTLSLTRYVYDCIIQKIIIWVALTQKNSKMGVLALKNAGRAYLI